MAFANQRVTFPMPELSALFNMGWAVGNGSATDDLSPSISTTSIALSPLFLTPKVAVKRAAERFIRINMAVAVVLKSLLVWDDSPADPNYGRSRG